MFSGRGGSGSELRGPIPDGLRGPAPGDGGRLEAAIPDAAALVFACLGVALALHGRHAIRARLLNVASVGAIAAREMRIATRLRAIERAYRKLDREAAPLKPAELSASLDKAVDRELELE